MLGSPYRYPDAAVTPGILAAITDENAALPHFGYKFTVQMADFRQYEICLADPEWNTMESKLYHQPIPSLYHLTNVARQGVAISKRFGQASKRDAVHVVG